MLSIHAWAFIFSLAGKLLHHQVPNLVTYLRILESMHRQLTRSFMRTLLYRLPLRIIVEMKAEAIFPIINTLNYLIADSNLLQNMLEKHKL